MLDAFISNNAQYYRVMSRYVDAEILRFPSCVARYTALKHERDPGNPLRYNDMYV